MPVRSYTELMAWRKAVDLVEAVYRRTAGFPEEGAYGLTIQLRRAAVSVAANIAEGQGRATTRDFPRFLSIANGSLGEAETHIFIAERLNFLRAIDREPLMSLSSEVGRLINGLSNALKRRESD